MTVLSGVSNGMSAFRRRLVVLRVRFARARRSLSATRGAGKSMSIPRFSFGLVPPLAKPEVWCGSLFSMDFI